MYVRKNGSTFPARICVSAIFDQDKKCIGYLGISENLTEEKNMLKLLDSQRAQMLATAKLSSLGELSAGIAHEINNPLAVIVGKSLQLRRMLSADKIDLKKIEGEIVKIEAMGQRISKTIKGMRLFSRNGDSDPFEVKNLKQIIDDTFQICYEKFKDNGIEVKIDIDENVFISCRPTQISQIVLNLLNNSFDAVCSHEEKFINLSCFIKGEQVFIKFVDSGPTIPEDIAIKMMEPFYTTKENGKGTGIGLSISRKIAEEHCGRLHLDRSTSLTTFILELPLKQYCEMKVAI